MTAPTWPSGGLGRTTSETPDPKLRVGCCTHAPRSVSPSTPRTSPQRITCLRGAQALDGVVNAMRLVRCQFGRDANRKQVGSLGIEYGDLPNAFCRHADIYVPAVGHVPDNLFIAEPDEEDVFFLVISDIHRLFHQFPVDHHRFDDYPPVEADGRADQIVGPR